MTRVLADHAEVLVISTPKCLACLCPATVKNEHTNELMCDRCCAESIVFARSLPVFIAECSETNWSDLSYAEGLRRILEYNRLITEFDVTTIH